MRPSCELAQVLTEHWKEIETLPGLNSWQSRTLRLLRNCRTAAMGGHVDGCSDCGHLQISYNSCRNRHCPKCQAYCRGEWLQARERELLPVPYFHVVFTLPEALNRLCLYEPARVYNLLFETAWSVLCSFASDPKHLGARTGMIAILHTWGQNLSLHPHLHCVVPGGGISGAGLWKTTRAKGTFLFPVKAMSSVFRARFTAGLRKQFREEPKEFFESLFKTPWVVYAKRPFGDPWAVMEYLGRYTHKIAISNHRLQRVANGEVTFSWKDYRDQAKKKIMTLSAPEFVRRFALHILPKAFVRIRHYGILSSRVKKVSIPSIHLQLKGRVIKWVKQVRGPAPAAVCPSCRQGRMITLLRFDNRGPPPQYLCLVQMTSQKN